MRNMILAVLYLALCTAARAEADEWAVVSAANPPQARVDHSLVTFPDGNVRLFGGANSFGELFNDLAVFNGSDWASEAADDPPPARRNHAAWSMDGQLFVHQGLGTGNTVLGDYWRYDPSTRGWIAVASAAQPLPRYAHVAVTQQTRLAVVAGGRSWSANLFDDIWMVDGGYNFVSHDTLPSNFEPRAALRVENLTYMIGRSGELYSYYPTERRWTELARLTNTAGFYCAAATRDGQGSSFLHAIGGYDATGVPSNLVYTYDITSNSWMQRPERMPAPTADHACASLPAANGATSVVVFGGAINGAPANQTWLFAPHGGTPPPAREPVCGPANNEYSLAPPAAHLLCAEGDPSDVVTSRGRHLWSCTIEDREVDCSADGAGPRGRAVALAVIAGEGGANFCEIRNADVIDPPEGGPYGRTMPYRAVTFQLNQCTGDRVTLKLTFSGSVRGYEYWKWNGSRWILIPEGIDEQAGGVIFNYRDNEAFLTIVDNGPYDTNPKIGEIDDPSGPVAPLGGGGGPVGVPALSASGLIATASLFGLFGAWWQRRRR